MLNLVLVIIGLVIPNIVGIVITAERSNQFAQTDLTAEGYTHVDTNIYPNPQEIHTAEGIVTIWTQEPMIVNLYHQHGNGPIIRMYFDECNGANMCMIDISDSSCENSLLIEVTGVAEYYMKYHHFTCNRLIGYAIIVTMTLFLVLAILCTKGEAPKATNAPAANVANVTNASVTNASVANTANVTDTSATNAESKNIMTINQPLAYSQYPCLTAAVMETTHTQMTAAEQNV